MSELKCPLHRKDYVTTTCTSNTCLRAPLICPICPDQHSDHS